MRLNILDTERTVSGTVHGSFGHYCCAALSAEPETIEELQAALARYSEACADQDAFAHFRDGLDEKPWDAGIGFMDLAARVAAWDSTYDSLYREGQVLYREGEESGDGSEEVWVSYCVPDDWVFLDSVEGWEVVAERRRRERAATPTLEAREVLYGKLPAFIAAECLAAAGDGAADPVVDIHVRWLMTPREDLLGQTPREVLLEKLGRIDRDVWSRKGQWSSSGKCPPGLSPDSHAYRYGGFGTHEYVLYYELVRHLLHSCWEQVATEPDTDPMVEAERLAEVQREWLYGPDPELHGYSPYVVISQERARLPMALKPEDILIDEDCPLCRMQAESDTPTFWNLDGSGMDDDFPFSFHATREEWEAEQREWEEHARKFDEEWAKRPPVEQATWQTSYFEADAAGDLPREQAIPILLIGIGGHLGELCGDLAAQEITQRLSQSLQEGFDGLRGAMKQGDGEHLEAHFHRLYELLAAVGLMREDLVQKRDDLTEHVRRLEALLGGAQE